MLCCTQQQHWLDLPPPADLLHGLSLKEQSLQQRYFGNAVQALKPSGTAEGERGQAGCEACCVVWLFLHALRARDEGCAHVAALQMARGRTRPRLRSGSLPLLPPMPASSAKPSPTSAKMW